LVANREIPFAPPLKKGEGCNSNTLFVWGANDMTDLICESEATRTPASPLRVGVLVSGNGSNLQALLDYSERRSCRFKVVSVISNCPGVFALERAQRSNVPTQVIEHQKFTTREEFEQNLIQALIGHSVDVVVLAGFMRMLTPIFLRAFPNRIVNVHPALSPSFPGAHAVKDALKYGVRITGCTVHLVDEGMDTGRILAQAAVPVFEGDDEMTLKGRIQTREHLLLPQVIEGIARGLISEKGFSV